MNPGSRAAALRLVNPAGLYDPAPNGYSHVAMVAAGARSVLIAGQGGENERGELAPDFQSQVRQAFRNLEIAATAGGAGIGEIAKLTVLVVDYDMEKLKIFGAELDRVWPRDALKPACTLIPVPRLALDGMLFEIEAVAVVGS
jgi:enamine deaminase RidA (YjgF/YER057c/UK114 family)